MSARDFRGGGLVSAWKALDDELDRWQQSESVATFWWRDDDAEAVTPALARLLGLSAAHLVPLGLAVIPAKAGKALMASVSACPATNVLQHGFAHANHAPSNEKKAEFGAHRPVDAMCAELKSGAERLEAIFDVRFLPVLVPPWNRVSQSLVPKLASTGLIGLSTFAPRQTASPAPRLKQINAHVDLIDWRGGRIFKGATRIAEEIAAHLSARRRSMVDSREPTGILSHHLVHDEGCWEFLEQLFARLRARENVRWLTPGEALDS